MIRPHPKRDLLDSGKTPVYDPVYERPIIARVRFNDGAVRPVFEGLDGRQYVQGGEVERVYGVWFIPPDGDIDLPVFVDCR